MAIKTRSYKEFYICSTSNASHIFRFTLVNARMDTQLYIHIHSKVCKKRGFVLFRSPPSLFYCSHILPELLMTKDNERRCIHPLAMHPLFDIGYVFIIRIFLNNENNEIMFKRNVDYCFVLNLNFIHSSLEFDNYKRKE